MLDFTPNLLNLPSEILHLIYNSIERLQNKKNFSLVNKQFNATHRNNTKTLYLKENNSITIEKSPQIFKNIKKLVIDCSMNTDPNSDQYYKITELLKDTISQWSTLTVLQLKNITLKNLSKVEKSNTPQEIESSKNQEFYSLTGIENCPNIKTLEIGKGNLYNQRQLTYTNLLLEGNNLEKVSLFKIEGLEKFHCNALENLKALIINRKYGIEDGNPKKIENKKLLTGHIKIHEKLFTITGTLPKLETFRVRYCNTRSLDGLANKVPNLKHLSIDLLHTDSHLSTTLEKFPFLEKLCILYTTNEEDNPWFSTVDFDNFRNLKALEITCNTRTLAEDIKQIPNLEALELHDNNPAPFLPFKEIASLFPNLKSLIAFKIKPSNMPPLDEIQKLTKLEHFVYITPDRLKGTRKVLKHLKSKEEIEKLCEELALTPTPNLDGAIAINQGVDERQV